jgi:hypothetical protein
LTREWMTIEMRNLVKLQSGYVMQKDDRLVWQMRTHY